MKAIHFYLFLLLGTLTACSGVYKASSDIQRVHLQAAEYYKSGNDQRAIELWQDVVANDEAHLEAWQNIAVVQERELHDVVAAEETLRAALRANPDASELECALGQLLQRKGDTYGGLALLKSARDRDATNAERLRDYAAGCFAAGNFNCALSEWRGAKALDSHIAGIDFNIGLALMQLGNPQEATLAFKDEIRASPLNSEAYGKLGDAYVALNQPQDAIAQYEKATQVEPKLPWPHYNLGVLLHESSPTVAERHYRRYLELAPSDGNAWTNLGLLMMNAGKLSEAVKAQRSAVAAGSDIAHFHFNLALVLSKVGCSAEAFQETRLALERDPNLKPASNLYLKLSKEHGFPDAGALARAKKSDAAKPACKT